MPGRGAGWVGQRDEIKWLPGAADTKAPANDPVQFRDGDELRDGEFADREDEPRSQNFDLAIEP